MRTAAAMTDEREKRLPVWAREKLRELRVATFQVLVDDAPDTLHVVARFLALLELFRERAVSFEGDRPLDRLIHTLRRLGDLLAFPRSRWEGWQSG